ncbi:MAG: immune inhibitor A [Candidatus Poseidoniaceae archaeon]|nr:immune inhibitor A [Candidatus Poseidoniaceae archaeon]
MRPRYGVPILVALLIASSWTFMNDDMLETWISENAVVQNQEEASLLQLQANERWLVLVVDFEDSPSTSSYGPEQAKLLLDDIASDYLEQISGTNTQLHIDVSTRITRASGPISEYGSDTNGNRDTDMNGDFLPSHLAEEVVVDQLTHADWDEYDLDDDGIVDRLLILHTSTGQEESPGQSNRIWSHFTHFDTGIEVDQNTLVEHYTMASIRTGSSGIGTILHEMMHQMGAMDLYPVHDSGQLNDWKGIGDWDIMASGNWNGGGIWPALPSSASLELLGANRSVEMDLSWPETAQRPCVGPTVDMTGMSENGTSLKIPIGEKEYVWIEYRSNYGFDQHLPGSGILVTYQDRSVGDEERNELNRDPEQPWLTVVEADGRTDLRNGANSGEASDLFLNGTAFGGQGVLIYTHDGILVPWTAHVEINVTVRVNFTAPGCTSRLSVDAPDFGAVLLQNQSFPLQVNIEKPCNLSSELIASDGRVALLEDSRLDTGTQDVFISFATPGTVNAESLLEGTISCGEDTLHLKTKILTVGRIPSEQKHSGLLQAYEVSTVQVPVDSIGEIDQSFTVELDGPISRIGTTEPRIVLTGDDNLVIEINPNGLLQDRMSVKGELVLVSQTGHRWVLQLEYTAVDGEESTLDEWRSPGRLLSIAGIICSIWVVLGMKEKQDARKDESTEYLDSVQPVYSPVNEDVETDAWGRELDMF